MGFDAIQGDLSDIDRVFSPILFFPRFLPESVCPSHSMHSLKKKKIEKIYRLYISCIYMRYQVYISVLQTDLKGLVVKVGHQVASYGGP
jgi:hypothetical protein